MPVGKTLADNWEAWIKAGALASEMESAALFIVAASLRAKAGAVFSVVWNQERQKLGLDNPHVHNPDDAIRAAVRAAELLIRNI
jgi:uridine phosphorylase